MFIELFHMRLNRWKPGGKADLSLGVTPTKWRWLAVGDLVLGSLLFGPSYGIYALASAQMATAIGFAILHLHHAVEGCGIPLRCLISIDRTARHELTGTPFGGVKSSKIAVGA